MPGQWRQRGKSFPLGAMLVPGGANFSLFAKHSTAAQLLLFDAADRRESASRCRPGPAYEPHLPLLARLAPSVNL